MAGGAGTRGRPYTEFFPKAMTPVEGRPAIAHVVGHLRASRAVRGIVVLADLAGPGGQVRNYLEGARGVEFVQDAQSGTGGDLLCLGPALEGESEFLLWFADNLCALDVAAMRRRFLGSGALACVATRSRRREGTGFADVEGHAVRRFVEKPVVDLPMAECLGMYVLSAEVLGIIRRLGRPQVNLSYDVLAGLAASGRVSAYDIGGEPWIDVESPAALARDAAAVRRIAAAMGRGGRARAPRSRPRASASSRSRRGPRAASPGRARRSRTGPSGRRP